MSQAQLLHVGRTQYISFIKGRESSYSQGKLMGKQILSKALAVELEGAQVIDNTQDIHNEVTVNMIT